MTDPRDEIGEQYFKGAMAVAQPAWAKADACLDCGVRLPRSEKENHGPVEHADGCPYAASLDDTSEKDRVFFETHREATEYRRPMTYSEMAEMRMTMGLDMPGSFHGRVLVRRVADGVRMRTFEGVYFVPDFG